MMKDKGDYFEKMYNEYNPDVKSNENNDVEMFIDDVKNSVKRKAMNHMSIVIFLQKNSTLS